jgi:hypothetical protein
MLKGELVNQSFKYWIVRSGLLIALIALLAGCGTAPTAQSQSGTTGDTRAGESSGLDQELLKQVDAQIAAAKAKGTDVTSAQLLRDAAVSLAQQQRYEEANGNLKTAALEVGVLRDAAGASAAAPEPTLAPPAPAGADKQAGRLLLSANFADPNAISGWQRVGPSIPTGTPVWEVQKGVLVQRGVDAVDAAEVQTGLVTGDPAWRDVTVQVDALAQDTREVGLIVRQQGESYYRFRALAVGTGSNTGNLLLEKVVNGQVAQLAAFDGPELGANAWHKLAVSVNGSTIVCSVDGRQVGSAEDSTLAAGRVGVSTLAMSGAHFANLQVFGR